MDKKFEKLVAEIMREAEADGEPVTKAEAEEMARMEMGAKADRRYEQSEVKKERKPKERKVDEEKGHILGCIKNLLVGMHADILAVKTETEVEFIYNGNHYTAKLTKHRPPKKQAVEVGALRLKVWHTTLNRENVGSSPTGRI